jgi:DNA repair protein RecO (recombination protein O)
MSKTYQTKGIILKKKPFGEADVVLTVLSPEYGLFSAIAPGARKYKSKLRGRSELLVVNEMLIIEGRSLDRITQLETLDTYPNLNRDLATLSVSQYLAELVLNLALKDEPQIELYELFKEHLKRLNNLENNHISLLYAYLSQAVFHLLAIHGIAPQFHKCCITNNIIEGDLNNPQWKIGFSFEAGGIIGVKGIFPINASLTALELNLMQHLGEQKLVEILAISSQKLDNLSLELAWVNIERCLRNYASYNLGRPFKSSTLIDSLFVLK